MSGREPGRSPDAGLEAVQVELDANNQALAKLEHALERDARNPYLLKKYERLSKREQLLLEERKLWAGAALQSQSWQSGLQAAPGVKALLERLVAASGRQPGEGQGLQQLGGGSERGGSGRYNTRRGAQFSPDKAQLMLLANAADASGGASRLETRKGRMLSSRGAQPAAKRPAGGRVKPFHVAKTSPPSEDDSEEGSGVDVPVALSQQERLADQARAVLAGLPSALESETVAEEVYAEASGSGASRESPPEPAAPASQEPTAAKPAAVAGTASTEGGGQAGGAPPPETAADRLKAQLLSEVQTPEGSTNAAAAPADRAAQEADEAVHMRQQASLEPQPAQQAAQEHQPAADESGNGEMNAGSMQIDEGPSGRSGMASQELRSVVPPT